ncbi:hypothetical protein ADUPG1_013491 [Aduncisulcus paluster]|uniref:Fcf2 pre-rRNA processing C-terminal domain-containing protein n=1 Tax=Aduncisulcus paluster TaxID=2918883 RepID=A0ABQ5K3N5_9EUKA|nr:hypothetical protein ADUPG1_013491 [Aduncisulcus paluster]
MPGLVPMNSQLVLKDILKGKYYETSKGSQILKQIKKLEKEQKAKAAINSKKSNSVVLFDGTGGYTADTYTIDGPTTYIGKGEQMRRAKEREMDIQALKMRHLMDPSVHYKKIDWDTNKTGAYVTKKAKNRDKTSVDREGLQAGVVISDSRDYFSARTSKKSRGKTVMDEFARDKVLSDKIRHRLSKHDIEKRSKILVQRKRGKAKRRKAKGTSNLKRITRK